MNSETPRINHLLREVEIYHKRPIRTTTDFEVLRLMIEHQINEVISASTLKRIWGYVNDKHKPRLYTLNILAKYIGYSDYDSYCKQLDERKVDNSQFFNTLQISSNSLSVGDLIEIGWDPNRYLLVQYEGENRYKVVKALNSKIVVGDQLIITNFMVKYPLYIPTVTRDGEILSSFLAGQNGGLTLLNKL